MKIRLRWRPALRRQGRFLLLIGLGLAIAGASFPTALAATNTRVSVVQAVSADLPVLEMKSIASPVTVQEFSQQMIDKLAAEAPFTDWKDASPIYYPLGPGTHSWLVNVMNGQQRIGYMIISATDQGGYMLSEYGAGTTGLPYSLSELRQLLVQQGLISSSASDITLSALYAPLLPVWKITIDEKTFFINASMPQILPWSLSKADAVLKGKLAANNVVTSRDDHLSPDSAYRSGGVDDPYADLLWLTVPKLPMVSADDIMSLIPKEGSIAFQAAGRNDALGAPFMITGYQRWLLHTAGSTKENSDTTVYVASGHAGRRYLPLSALQDNGTLHKLNGNKDSIYTDI
ncbi:hypothetical protein [Paenibacillus monticola]|uniref:Uncharacterized protein n=1 Tax=Paenibacillus monticola TaxID=2666075 RepID=A0A7X2H3I8_9BACL|nr:hypothetical protein [Paenibacillus monticola]MRN52753.1 hypothetical protein [Paenibacillus monticola]